MCRARLLEAAEQVARAYLPRTAPMWDDDSGSFGRDTNHSNEEENIKEATAARELSHNLSAKFSASRMSADPQEAASDNGFNGSTAARCDGVLDARNASGTLRVVCNTEGSVYIDPHGRSYWRLKRASLAYRARRAAMLSTPTFAAWLVGGRDKQKFCVDGRGVVPLAQPADPSSPPPKSEIGR